MTERLPPHRQGKDVWLHAAESLLKAQRTDRRRDSVVLDGGVSPASGQSRTAPRAMRQPRRRQGSMAQVLGLRRRADTLAAIYAEDRMNDETLLQNIAWKMPYL
jgi:hypothetical protein